MLARSTLAFLLLTGLASTSSSSAPSRVVFATYFGSPCICFPVDIGSAESLPFGKDSFQCDPKFTLDRVAPETLRILAASEDPFVHIETLRRAILYCSGEGEAKGGGEARKAAVGLLFTELNRRAGEAQAGRAANLARFELRQGGAMELRAGLRALGGVLRVDAAEKGDSVGVLYDPAQIRPEQILAVISKTHPTAALSGQEGPSSLRLALPQFDLGYAAAAFSEYGMKRSEDAAGWLAKASARCPEDGAMRLGAALALFQPDRKASMAQLELSIESAGSQQGALRKNLLRTMGAILDADSMEELKTKAAEMRARR